jgi:CH-like domain in sperm protein
MTDILTNWINQDIKLSLHVTHANAEQAFRNGYLYGELLAKLLNDPSVARQFLKVSQTSAMISNYVALERVLLTRLDARVSPNLVVEVVKGVQGSAYKLVYVIKSAVDAAKKRAKEDGELISTVLSLSGQVSQVLVLTIYMQY